MVPDSIIGCLDVFVFLFIKVPFFLDKEENGVMVWVSREDN